MKTKVRKTVQLGELIVAVFDSAALYSKDPREISRLATAAVMQLLRRARITSPHPSTPTTCVEANAVS